MRLLYFTKDYTTHDRRFLAKMVESPHEVLLLCLQDDGSRADLDVLPKGVRAIRWKGVEAAATPDACVRLMPVFSQVLEAVNPDLVHAGPLPSCAFIAALSGVRPLMVMSWGSDILFEAKDNPLTSWACTYALAHADAFVVDCDAVREEIRAVTGANNDRFVQFPWGLELARFGLPPPHARRPGEITVLCTRAWESVYGVETALHSFALAHAEEPRLRLVLIGKGSLAPVVEATIERYRLGAFVRRPGRVPEAELGEYFMSADVYLSCALSDGTSVSLLEAMAHGVPAVVTDVGGNPEWIEPECGGWLAPVGDARAFAMGILRAARLDDASRKALVDRNRRIIEERADWHRNTRRLLDAYDRLGAGRWP